MYKYTFLFLALFLVACQTNKQVSCPDFKSSETMMSKQKNKQKRQKTTKKRKAPKEKKDKLNLKLKALDLLVGNLDLAELLAYESKMQELVSDSICPIVVLQDQSIIYARVGEIQNDSLQISPCDSSGQSNGNSFKLSKSYVWSVEYLPEEFDLEKSKQEMQQQLESPIFYDDPEYASFYDEEYDKTERLARNGLIFALVSLFIWPLGIVALVLCGKSLKRYRNLHPEYEFGKGMAVAGLVIGILSSLWTLFLLFIIVVNLIIFGF